MEIGKLLLKYPWIMSKCIQDSLKQVVSFFELEKVHLLSGRFTLLVLIRLSSIIACFKTLSLSLKRF